MEHFEPYQKRRFVSSPRNGQLITSAATPEVLSTLKETLQDNVKFFDVLNNMIPAMKKNYLSDAKEIYSIAKRR